MHARKLLHKAVLGSVLVLTFSAITNSVAAQPLDLRLSHLICDKNKGICLLTDPGKDSDGDGYSDEDERTLGTDPQDPQSNPTVGRFLELMPKQPIPSFESGRTVLFVSPTQTPDGRPLGGVGSIASLLSKFDFPERKTALERLGLDMQQIEAAGLNLNNGLTIGRPSLGSRSGGKIGGPHGKPLFVGGIRFSLIAAGKGGYNPVTVMETFMGNISNGPNAGKPVTDVHLDVTGKGATATFADGTKDVSTSKRIESPGKSFESVKHVSYDANGREVGSAETTRSKETAKDGSVKETTTTVRTTELKDGTKVTTEKSWTFTTDSKGEVWSSSHSDTKTITNPDGTTQTTTVSTKDEFTKGGKEGTHTSSRTITEKDKNGNTTSEIKETTSVTFVNGTTVTSTTRSTECTGAASKNCPDHPYVDPDAEVNAIILTPAQIAQTVEILSSIRTKHGDTILQYLTPADAKDPKDITPIALIDGDLNLSVVLVHPNIWTRGPLPDNNDPSVLPELDPSTLDEPGNSPSDQAEASLFLRGISQLTGPPRP